MYAVFVRQNSILISSKRKRTGYWFVIPFDCGWLVFFRISICVLKPLSTWIFSCCTLWTWHEWILCRKQNPCKGVSSLSLSVGEMQVWSFCSLFSCFLLGSRISADVLPPPMQWWWKSKCSSRKWKGNKIKKHSYWINNIRITKKNFCSFKYRDIFNFSCKIYFGFLFKILSTHSIIIM